MRKMTRFVLTLAALLALASMVPCGATAGTAPKWNADRGASITYMEASSLNGGTTTPWNMVAQDRTVSKYIDCNSEEKAIRVFEVRYTGTGTGKIGLSWEGCLTAASIRTGNCYPVNANNPLLICCLSVSGTGGATVFSETATTDNLADTFYMTYRTVANGLAGIFGQDMLAMLTGESAWLRKPERATWKAEQPRVILMPGVAERLRSAVPLRG